MSNLHLDVLPEYINAKPWFQRSSTGGWSRYENNYNDIRRMTLKHWLRCYAKEFGWTVGDY